MRNQVNLLVSSRLMRCGLALFPARRARRRVTRIALEALETRQLLSVSSSGVSDPVAVPSVAAAPLSLFPTGDPVVVVVIVPVGSYRVVVLVPVTPPPTAHSPFASGNHPVEAPVSTEVSLPLPTPTTFGQDTTVDSLRNRPIRWDSDGEVAAVFDIVEPFQPPAFAPSGKSSAPDRTEATALVPPAATLPWRIRVDDDRSQAETAESDLLPAVRTAAPLGENRDETLPADSGGTLAGTAVLAGAAYWLALRGSNGQEESREPRATGRRFQPRVGKCLTPRA